MNYEEDYYEEEKEERKQKKGWIQSFQNLLLKTDNDYYDEEEEEEEYERVPQKRPVSIWSDTITLEAAKQIIMNLRNGEEQIVNFENSEKDVENDIRYFLYGSVFALDGNIESISKSSIIITPKGTSIEKPDSKIRRPGFTSPFKLN